MDGDPLGLVDGKVLCIRRARQDDLDRLLWAGEHLRANRQRFLDSQTGGKGVILVPTLDDVPIGHLAMDRVRLRDDGGVYLYWFEVRPEFRGRGIGAAVIHHAEKIAAAEGYFFSEIAVGMDNESARRLYERLGYRMIGERVDRWIKDLPDGSHVEVADHNLVMRKALGAEGEE